MATPVAAHTAVTAMRREIPRLRQAPIPTAPLARKAKMSAHQAPGEAMTAGIIATQIASSERREVALTVT
jgi:hypothetical protein